MYVKKPPEHRQCLIFEPNCFHEWDVTAFVMSEYYKNGLLMDEHLKGCSSPLLHLLRINLAWFTNQKILNFLYIEC